MFLKGQVPQPFHHLLGPPLDPLHSVHIFLILWGPEVDAVLQVWPDECWGGVGLWVAKSQNLQEGRGWRNYKFRRVWRASALHGGKIPLTNNSLSFWEAASPISCLCQISSSQCPLHLGRLLGNNHAGRTLVWLGKPLHLLRREWWHSFPPCSWHRAWTLVLHCPELGGKPWALQWPCHVWPWPLYRSHVYSWIGLVSDAGVRRPGPQSWRQDSLSTAEWASALIVDYYQIWIRMVLTNNPQRESLKRTTPKDKTCIYPDQSIILSYQRYFDTWFLPHWIINIFFVLQVNNVHETYHPQNGIKCISPCYCHLLTPTYKIKNPTPNPEW